MRQESGSSLVALIVGSLFAGPVARAAVSGVVRNSGSNDGVPGAIVSVQATDMRTVPARAASAGTAVQMEHALTLQREEVRTQRFKAFLTALGGQTQSALQTVGMARPQRLVAVIHRTREIGDTHVRPKKRRKSAGDV